MLVVADYVVFSAVAALDKLNQNLKRYRHSEIYGALIEDKWTFLKLTSNHHVWPGLKYTGSTKCRVHSQIKKFISIKRDTYHLTASEALRQLDKRCFSVTLWDFQAGRDDN